MLPQSCCFSNRMGRLGFCKCGSAMWLSDPDFCRHPEDRAERGSAQHRMGTRAPVPCADHRAWTGLFLLGNHAVVSSKENSTNLQVLLVFPPLITSLSEFMKEPFFKQWNYIASFLAVAPVGIAGSSGCRLASLSVHQWRAWKRTHADFRQLIKLAFYDLSAYFLYNVAATVFTMWSAKSFFLPLL